MRHLCRRCLKQSIWKEAAEGKRRLREVDDLLQRWGLSLSSIWRNERWNAHDFHINVNIKGVWNSAVKPSSTLLEFWGGGSIVIASSVAGDIVADAGEAACIWQSSTRWLNKMLGREYADRHIRVTVHNLDMRVRNESKRWPSANQPRQPESAIKTSQ